MKPHKRKGRQGKIARQQRAIQRAEAKDPAKKLLKEIFSKEKTG